ncbi:peroxisomal membrane protein PMP34 isoform X2 [Amia ocellicauda]
MSMTVFFPLDTARLMLQVDDKRSCRSTPAVLSDIIREEGLLAPYRGWLAVICSVFCSSFIYFYCFHSLRAVWGLQPTPTTDLMVGIIAGVVNVLVTTPLWVVNTRIKLQGANLQNANIRPTCYSGIVDGLVQTVRGEGLGGLWNGTVPSLLLVLNPAVQFSVYQGLKRHLGGDTTELSSLQVFVMGAVSKTVATVLTYPLQTAQSLLRCCQSSDRQAQNWNRSWSLLSQRVRTQGMLCLFRGLEAKLLQTVLTAALMFLLYENIAHYTFQIIGTNRDT